MELLLSVFAVVFLFVLHLIPFSFKSYPKHIKGADCTDCATALEVIEIRNKPNLMKALKHLDEHIKKQNISEVIGGFEELTKNNSWPRRIQHEFICRKCKTKIRLFVNVYGPKGHETFNGQLVRLS